MMQKLAFWLALLWLGLVGCGGDPQPKELGVFILSRGQLTRIPKQQPLDKPADGVTYAVGFRNPPAVAIDDSIPRFAFYDADVPSKIEQVRLLRLGYVGTRAEAGFLLTPARAARINLYLESRAVPTAVTPDKRDPRLFWLRAEQPLNPGCYALIVPFLRTSDQRLDDDDTGYAFRISGPKVPPLDQWERGGVLRTYTSPRTDDAYSRLKGQLLAPPLGPPLLFADLFHPGQSRSTARVLVVSGAARPDGGNDRQPEDAELTGELAAPVVCVVGQIPGGDECEFVWIRHRGPLSDEFLSRVDALVSDLDSRGQCYIALPEPGELVVVAPCVAAHLADAISRLPSGICKILDQGSSYITLTVR